MKVAQTTDYFGLDLGATGARLIKLKKGADYPAVTSFGSVNYDPNLRTSDSPTDRKKLAEIIKGFVKESRVNTKQVVAGLSSSKIHTFVVNVPKMSAHELEKSIKYQAEQYIPRPLDEVKLDWMVVGEDAEQLEVLLAAVGKKEAEALLQLLEAAELEVLALEPAALSLARIFNVNPGTAAVILDIGQSNSDLVTVLGGTPKLVRSIAVGMDTFVKSAAQSLGLDEGQANQFVYKFGMTQSKLEGQVYNAIKTAVDNLASEVGKSNKFFLSKYTSQEVQIEKVILAGAGTVLPELTTYLANAVNLPVEVGNPWSKISLPAAYQEQLTNSSYLYTTAAGLALREFSE